MFIKWVYHLFPGCAQIRWALGGEHVYKMGLPSFPWEGVHKYDRHWEVNMFIKWVYNLFPGRVCTNTMGRVRFIK